MRVPYHTKDLRISDSTTVDDVIEFVGARLQSPAVLDDDVVVWNFNSHPLDSQALRDADLDPGVYVNPYQVPGVWGFVVEILPNELSQADLLVWRNEEECYASYETFVGQVEEAQVRARLGEVMVDV